MVLKTCLIFCIFMVTDICIHSNERDVETRGNELCEITLSAIFCEGLSGKFLPSDSSVYVKEIFIIESNLSSLSENDFTSLENLELIHIDSCTIAYGNNILSPVKRLQTLEIINSNVSEEVFNLLGSAKHLVKLSLERNKITHITKEVFKSLTYPEEADLHHIETSDVINSSTPKKIENKNPSRVKRQDFDSLSHLEEINFSHNEISTIGAHAFDGLSALRKLDLSHNRLTSVLVRTIQKGVFDHLPRLEEIDLNHNKIFIIEANAFRDLPALRQLNLSYNDLGRLEYYPDLQKGAFGNLPRLEEVDLSHNKISTIEADAFRGLPALRRLDLSQNPLGDDFDMSSLSLPAGCVFQSLVAICPGLAGGYDPSDEYQRSEQEATTDDPRQQRRPSGVDSGQGTRTHGGVASGGVLCATLLATLPGLR